MKKSTLKYIVHIINTQLEHAQKTQDAIQEAYCTGMRDMLDIVLSEAYKIPAGVEIKNGRVKIFGVEYMEETK